MQCQKCHGTGRIKESFIPHLDPVCPDCNGSGVASCCDGEQAQPCPVEKDKD